MNPKIERVNENSLLIRFGDAIDKNLPAVIASVNNFLINHFGEVIVDTIPAYTTLLVIIDDSAVEFADVERNINRCLATWQPNPAQQNPVSTDTGRDVLIPAYYDPEVAPDLESLAREKGLSIKDIQRIHSDIIYTVYAIGFAPGFAFLGNVDERIATPRLATPRQLVAKGSIGIAGLQTGIYPRSSPGGWNIIGRTSLEMFFPEESAENLCPLRIGDRVRFTPVSRTEFIALGGLTES